MTCFARRACRAILNKRWPTSNWNPPHLRVTPAPPNRDQLLKAQIIQPDPVFQRVHLAEFVGREWLTAKVDGFLNDPLHRSGVFVLTGEVGVGKTTFLAHLVQQRNYIQLFGEQVPGAAQYFRAHSARWRPNSSCVVRGCRPNMSNADGIMAG